MNVTRINLNKGLDLPLAGAAVGGIVPAPPARSVGVVGIDCLGMKPSMRVAEGARVALGQPLFEDQGNPGVCYTSPGSGVVKAINRGERRVLQSVVIELDGDDEVRFPAHSAAELVTLDAEAVKSRLLVSGLWTALRRRPFSKVPAATDVAAAIFVTAIDTNPLAPDPQPIIAEQPEAFAAGITALSRLTAGEVFVCCAAGAALPVPALPQLRVAEFAGPHPAGLPGTHMHFLKPVGTGRSCWYIGYQDVIAIGKLFLTGRIWVERVVSVAGPMVEQPALLRSRLGASVDELTAGRIMPGDVRVIVGSVFNGRRSLPWSAYMGRFHQQLTILEEGREREPLGWLRPGPHKFSVTRVFVSALAGARKRFGLSTSTHGSPRAMVPIGSFEKVMPLDILPTQLLRYLLVKDTDTAQQLGALELDEEDLALCSFVCVGKHDYGTVLRANLDQIEVEG